MLTFAMSYNEAENYILPLSHDEVVHLKCSMLEKMPGYEVDKFANLRAGYTFMLGHAGKKLLFMGQEFGQKREWSEKRELDWYLLQEPLHMGMKNYVADLYEIYQNNPCLYEIDNNWGGFSWINADDSDRSIYSFARMSEDGKNAIVFVINFTPMNREGFKLGVPWEGTYTKLIDSADSKYGGFGTGIPDKLVTSPGLCDYKDQSISFDLPSYGAVAFLWESGALGKKSEAKKETAKTASKTKSTAKTGVSGKAQTAAKASADKKTASKKKTK